MESIADGFREGTPSIILNGCLSGWPGINRKLPPRELPVYGKTPTAKYILYLIERFPLSYY
jgi:hypothetical protein